ncbi:MAG: hypothetical protein NVS1B6_14020 [Steroidobacteraceae bacterium]
MLTKAEWVAGGIRVDRVHFVAFGVVDRFAGWLQEPGAQGDRFLVSRPEIVDVQVEMDLLLRHAIGPIGGNMIRRELHTEPPLAVDQYTMPIVVLYDCATEESCPERALGGQIGGVEHDYLSRDFHAVTFSLSKYYASETKKCIVVTRCLFTIALR